ncbi:transcriptional regulator [Enterococcus sp. CU9D]|nr:helix-turn-helix transcriptional regulator [Enterococcus sp. CU9D]KAF1292988.1 transcriptional regulator [Enterococcus sp. CU9D]
MLVKNKIREFRNSAGISQEDLAIALSVSRQTIYAIESGKYNPSLELSLLLAKFFGVTIEQIFQLEEDENE